MRMRIRSACGTFSSSSFQHRSVVAPPPILGKFELRRAPTCSCHPVDVFGGQEKPGSRVPRSAEQPTVSLDQSPQGDASDTGQRRGSQESSASGLEPRQWMDSWEPVKPKGCRQYAASESRAVDKSVLPVLNKAPKLKGVRVYGKRVQQALKSRVALRIVDEHGSVLLIRQRKNNGHRGLWQTPSLPLHPTGCAHRQGIIIARGFLETVATQFSLKPFTFMSSMRLGQPMLVLVLEATVKHEDVRPSQAGFAKGEFMWASQMQYADLHDQISQVLYMRSTWNVRGKHPATVSFHSQPGFEERHRGPASTSITDIKDFKEQSFPTKNQLFLFVAAVCVYDKEAGKVLIAQRVKDKNRQNKGCWEWPGGKVDAGETVHQAAVREIKEEIDIDLDITALQPLTFVEKAYFSRNLVIMYYTCSEFTGTARGAEGQPIAWVTRTHLQKQRPQFLKGDDLIADLVVQHMIKDQTDSNTCT